MSIESSQPPPGAQSRGVERSDHSAAGEQRAPPSREHVERFRSLMQARGQAHEHDGASGKHARNAAEPARTADSQPRAPQPFERGDEESGRHRHRTDALPPGDNAVQLAAQLAAPPPASAPAAPLPVNPNAFADLLERHVRQLAVSAGGVGKDGGQVLLRLSDSALPGTDLLLSRTADGWLLRADVRSRGSFDAIRDAAPALAKRFAERKLGTLTIDPHYHG